MLTNTQENNVALKDEKAGTQVALGEAAPSKPAYVSPRIVTHSAEKLQQTSHPVNACSSFIP